MLSEFKRTSISFRQRLRDNPAVCVVEFRRKCRQDLVAGVDYAAFTAGDKYFNIVKVTLPLRAFFAADALQRQKGIDERDAILVRPDGERVSFGLPDNWRLEQRLDCLLTEIDQPILFRAICSFALMARRSRVHVV